MAGNFPYEDIVNLSPHISKKYPQASMSDRAARFSPFAAITGYEDMVLEAARVTEEKIDLDENLKRVLDEQLVEIRRNLDEAFTIIVTHFIPDVKKSGGVYVDTMGVVKKIDDYHRLVVMRDGEQIHIDNIYKMEICYKS